jgi:hypothetical protein
MRRLSRIRPSIERLVADARPVKAERLPLCRLCAARNPHARSSRAFSAAPPRSQEKEKVQIPQTWAGLEWVGTPEWTDAYMAPIEPFEP